MRLESKNKSKEIILFVFEGEKTETIIYKSLQKCFLNEKRNAIIYATFNAEIYQLYQKVKLDEFNIEEAVDLVEELKSKNIETLQGIEQRNITEMYLFFDYDGHATNASDDKIKEMLCYFDNETENGKLFISYPMVEAIKHLKSGINFQETMVDAKENINYKNLASQNCDNIFNQIKKWEINHWAVIIHEHCSKLNFITTDNYAFPNRTFEQIEIFEAQLEKYITPENKVAVLSAFPLLLLDYYGAKALCEKISNPEFLGT